MNKAEFIARFFGITALDDTTIVKKGGGRKRATWPVL